MMNVEAWNLAPPESVDRSGMMMPFEDLFLRQYPRLVSVAYRVVADRAEAEDIAQEVLWRFHRLHPDGAEQAAGWLHVAAVHTALNAIRSRRRRQGRELAHARMRDWNGDPPADPELVLETRERRRQVRSAMGRLPRKAATVLALRYGGLSYAEVAESMGVGVGQVGTLLRRAETALRKEVDNDASN